MFSFVTKYIKITFDFKTKINYHTHTFLLYAYKQALKATFALVMMIPSGLGYCALSLNWREVEENIIFYSEVNVHRKSYKHLKYKRLMLAKLIKFY